MMTLLALPGASWGQEVTATPTPTSQFYLDTPLKNLTISVSYPTCWAYDSIEWPDEDAATNPIIGTCYTAVMQGEAGIQFAAMNMSHDGYTSPWMSFWGDSSWPGVWVYPKCVADNYAGRSYTAICAQACPQATPGSAGTWPKQVDGDYVATWKLGCRKNGTLTISNMGLIRYGIPSDPATPTPIPTCEPGGALVQSSNMEMMDNCQVPTLIPTNTPRHPPTETPTPSETPTPTMYPTNTPHHPPMETPTETPTPTPTPVCPWYGTPDTTGTNCLYTYDRDLAVSYAERYKTTVNPNFCGFNYGGVDCDGTNSGTDCANFVSQVLHFGGLPMTTPAWNCQMQITKDQLVCSDYPPNWAGATFLPAYLKNSPIEGHDPGGNSNIVPYDAAFGLDDARNTGPIPNVIFDWTTSLATSGLTKGDVLYTDQPPEDEHMAMVAGWGPYFTRWPQLEAFNNDSQYPENWAYWCDGRDTNNNLLRMRSICTVDPTNGLCTGFQDPPPVPAPAGELDACSGPNNLSPIRTTCCTVPYVIDHGNNYLLAIPQVGYEAGPKPYYALLWAPPGHDPNEIGTGAATQPWYFIHIPTGPISFSLAELLDPTTFETREIMDPTYVP